ncbi:MAG: hypothetical protein K2L68_04315, partial [Muribaculaceae bacterium]|nr:hypothetical protein [Muribaculaceae bacterium]
MKRLTLRMLSALMCLVATFVASAQDEFSYTLRWDTPGAVTVAVGSITSAPVEMDGAATSYVVTEQGSSYIRPAAGYIIKSVTDQNGVSQRISGGEQYGGQYCSLSCFSSKNGYVYDIVTEKLSKEGEIEIDVVNGARKVVAYFLNDNSDIAHSTYIKPQLADGVQKVALTAYDKVLVISPTKDLKSLYSIKKNGESVNPGSYVSLPVADGDKIEIRAYEEAPEMVDVELSVAFTEGSEGCVTSVYNRSMYEFIGDELLSSGKVVVEKGQTIQFNFNEDFIIKSINRNGTEETVPAEGDVYRFTIEENTLLTFDAVAKVYEDVPAVIYAVNGDGLVIRKGAFDDDEEIALGEGEDVAEDVTFTYSNGKTFVIKGGTAKKYIVNAPGKTRKFFFDARPGYWVDKAILANPEDPDYTNASPGVSVENAPLYVVLSKIEATTHAVVYYEGEENAARFYAENGNIAGHIPVDGVADMYLKAGYTDIYFDPTYHKTFSTGKAGGESGREIVAYLDGRKLSYDDDNMAYSGMKLGDGSVLKVFSVKEGENPDLHTVRFIVGEGCGASVMYDKVKSLASIPKSLDCIGATLVEITPENGTSVMVDSAVVAPDGDGVCAFMTSRTRHVVELVKEGESGVDSIGSDSVFTGKIYNIHGIEMKGDFESLPAGIYVVD